MLLAKKSSFGLICHSMLETTATTAEKNSLRDAAFVLRRPLASVVRVQVGIKCVRRNEKLVVPSK